MNDSFSRSAPASRIARLGSTFALAWLAACGGGGGGGGAFTPLDFPFDSVLSAYWQAARVHNLSNAASGGNISVRIERTPGAAGASFEGQPALVAAEVATFSVGGVPDIPIRGRHFYTVNPFVSRGNVDDDTGEYTVANQTAAFPARATVGQSGALGTSTTYADATKTQVVDTSVNTWSVEADTASTAMLCINGVKPGDTHRNGIRVPARRLGRHDPRPGPALHRQRRQPGAALTQRRQARAGSRQRSSRNASAQLTP